MTTRVLMIGPSLDVKGGMTSVSKAILGANSSDIHIEFHPSMHDRSLIGRISHWSARILTCPIRAVFRRPDVVHIHVSNRLSVWRKLSILLVWRMCFVPVVLHTHGSGAKDHLGGLRGIRRLVMRFGFRSASRLVVLSESWADFYSETCGLQRSKISILPNPVLIPEDNPTKQIGPLLVIYTGVIGERKGSFDLIRAWATIPETVRSSCRLKIAGNGQIEEARNLAEGLGISDTCEILGWISDAERDGLLSRGSIYVLPSFNEGLPMGLLEAMANRMAVITTPVGGIPELVEDGENGLFVEPGDASGISKAIESLASSEERRDSLANNAFASVRGHGLDEYMKGLSEIWAKA